MPELPQPNQALLDAALRYTPHGKRVLITGGTKGIGRAAVEEMAQLGAHVFTCARREEDLQELLTHCKDQGWDVQGIAADVSQPEGRKTLLDAVTAAWSGELDVLVNVREAVLLINYLIILSMPFCAS